MPEKLDRCVEKVSQDPDVKEPYAVCKSSLKEANQPEELKRIAPLKIDLLKVENETPGTLDNLGQPNIVDYMNKKPFLTSMSERGLGGGQPGTILPNNEPSSRSPKPTDGYRPGEVFDKTSGKGAVGSEISQPTIPTGAPTSKPSKLATDLEPLDSEYSYKEMKEALIKGDMKRLLREAFDPVDNAWPVGEPNPDHGCSCQIGKDNSTTYSSKGSTLYKQATPYEDYPYTREEGDIGIGKQAPPDSYDTNIVPRATQAFSDLQETLETRDGSKIASKGIPISPLWKEKHDGIADTESEHPTRTINLKVELVKPETDVTEFDIDEPIEEWKEALSIANSGRSSAFSNTKKQEALTLGNAGRTSDPNLEAEIPREDEFSAPSVVVGTVKYFPEEQTMEVELNGRKYPYFGVSYREFNAFKGAPSKGKHYNDFFKGKFGPSKSASAVNQEALNKAILYREAIISQNPDDFHWIDEEAMKEMIMEGKKGKGKYILLKAAEAATTDHRVEGESYQRIITPELLKKLTYTAIRKGSDINHTYPKRDINSGAVIDAEFNDKTGFSEFIYFETDPEILQGIADGYIDSVSINGGAARSYKIIDGAGNQMDNPDIQCSTGECFRLGEGIILGEKDNVAFTWVVTRPGWRYNGRMIPHTVPGVKTTGIFVLE